MSSKLQRKVFEEVPVAEFPAEPARAWLAGPADADRLSPARQLQAQLAQSMGESVEHRWSARRTVAFVTLSCAGFWAAAAVAVNLLINLA